MINDLNFFIQKPYRYFRATRETMASDPEGQLSDQSDIPANSEVIEVVINCVVSKDNVKFRK